MYTTNDILALANIYARREASFLSNSLTSSQLHKAWQEVTQNLSIEKKCDLARVAYSVSEGNAWHGFEEVINEHVDRSEEGHGSFGISHRLDTFKPSGLVEPIEDRWNRWHREEMALVKARQRNQGTERARTSPETH